MGIGEEQDEMAILSPDRLEWIRLKVKLPYKVYSTGAVYLNGEIYVLHHQSLQKLDKNLKWTTLASMHTVSIFLSQNYLVWDGSIWVFGCS